MTPIKSIAIAAAIAAVLGFSGTAFAQSKTLTGTANGKNGAAAVLAQRGLNWSASAGASGTNVYTDANVGKYKYVDSSGKYVSAYASADKGKVATDAATPKGTASASANGTEIWANSGGSQNKYPGGSSSSLYSSAGAKTGGAWAEVATPNWYGLSVGVGDNVNVNVNFNKDIGTPPTGGKG